MAARVAGNQPVTPVAETIGGLLLGQPAGTRLWITVAWCCGVVLVSTASAILFHRRTA